MMFGLRKKDIAEIRSVLQAFPEVKQALVFGSRARGNNRPGSDVDLALKGADFHTAAKIGGILNYDTLMPYHFDVLSYQELNNKALLDHIDRIGKSLYEAEAVILLSEPSAEYKKEKG